MSDLPRLVATDLDGTLCGADGLVSDRTRHVLEALDARDVPVVFVTGRPLRWAREVFEHVGSHGLAVVSNGALLWDITRDRAVRTRGITAADARDWCEALRAAVPGTAFGVESLAGLDVEPAFVERFPLPEGARRAPLADLLTDEPASAPLKLLARHEDLGPQEFWDLAERATGGSLTITWSSSTTLLEVSAAGVTKATTLADLCADLGVAPEEVIAFGDMPNDLPMLRWAGRSYAMEGAHESVLAVADHVAPDHAEDGVARVLAGVFDLPPDTLEGC
ncbi:HAD family hydrolase [Nocardioides sp. GY 10127]|uniref:HAD family hydrolase n=1 Tax=Nocardioides sp. GY 10127 TaxID=2569762 RepID=UPI0010A9297B|nr:HAD family hydrolase [Nocardioides sp. GY 10127]TIC82699.1 HAD family hydrolase [Nocardioides sp. GY 10127]